MAIPESGPAPEPAAFPRRFDGYLRTSSLGTDALGSVFRALLLDDSAGGFARLRIFDAPELPRDQIAAALREQQQAPQPLQSPVIVEDSRLDLHEGVPFLAWREAHGYSLDRLLSELTAAGRLLPVADAFFIADRLALALEHAARAGRNAARHGLIWPGFVTIGRDGDVRLGGFGTGPVILPLLSLPRLSSEIAPYVAPETRDGRAGGPLADVYSVAAVLFELLTGARPPAFSAGESLPSQGKLPRGVADVLRTALARADVRTASPGLLRRQIGHVLVTNAISPSSHALGQLVGELLEPFRDPSQGSPVPVVVSPEEEQEWAAALSRLEPAGEGIPLPLSRSGPKARVPVPPAYRGKRLSGPPEDGGGASRGRRG